MWERHAAFCSAAESFFLTEICRIQRVFGLSLFEKIPADPAKSTVLIIWDLADYVKFRECTEIRNLFLFRIKKERENLRGNRRGRHPPKSAKKLGSGGERSPKKKIVIFL